MVARKMSHRSCPTTTQGASAMSAASLSRRDFLRTSAALSAAAAFPTLVNAKDENAFGGFTIGIQSYTFRNFKLEQAVKKIAELGVNHVEFFNGHVPVN